MTHYTYDGLGRVIRVQRPEKPDANHATPALRTVPTTLKITDTYYDGVRPLQEVVRRRVPMREEVTGSSPGQVTHRLPLQADGSPTSKTVATGPLASIDGSAWKLEKEYVHAADPGAYVDEVLAQLVYVDADGEPVPTSITLYTLQDPNFNVVALTDGYGRLAAQYTYFPYGQVRSSEIMADDDTGTSDNALPDGSTDGPYWARVTAAARTNRLGHQGLPVERLDATKVESGVAVTGSWSDPMGSDGDVDWGGVGGGG